MWTDSNYFSLHVEIQWGYLSSLYFMYYIAAEQRGGKWKDINDTEWTPPLFIDISMVIMFHVLRKDMTGIKIKDVMKEAHRSSFNMNTETQI